MNQTTIHRLQMARYQIVLGSTELAKLNELAAAQAVIHFHDALETILIVIADEVGVSRRRVDFIDYVPQIHQQNKGMLRHAKVLDEVNDFRVAAKHRGVYPSLVAVKDLDYRVNLFAEENVRTFFNKAFDEISLGDLVMDPRAKAEIKSAEASIAASSFDNALSHLGAAFELVIHSHQQTLPLTVRSNQREGRELFRRVDVERIKRKVRDSQIPEVLTQANAIWERFINRLDPVLLGIDPVAYQRFKIVTPRVLFTDAESWHSVKTYSRLVATKGTCDFCLKFVVDAALRLQSVLRIHDSWSKYEIRVVKETDYHRLADSQWTKAGTLKPGEIISDAVLTVAFELGGECWAWTTPTDSHLVAFDACEILKENSR